MHRKSVRSRLYFLCMRARTRCVFTHVYSASVQCSVSCQQQQQLAVCKLRRRRCPRLTAAKQLPPLASSGLRQCMHGHSLSCCMHARTCTSIYIINSTEAAGSGALAPLSSRQYNARTLDHDVWACNHLHRIMLLLLLWTLMPPLSSVSCTCTLQCQ
jgi:hypothetical protein